MDLEIKLIKHKKHKKLGEHKTKSLPKNFKNALETRKIWHFHRVKQSKI